MLFHASVIFLLSSSICNANGQETTTNIEKQITSTNKPTSTTELTTLNITESNLNVSLLRITQPSSNVERFSDTKGTEITNKNVSKSTSFVPSPQLETYFEFNRFPVTPAFPEAKNVYPRYSYLPPTPTKPYPNYAQDKHSNVKPGKPNFNNFFYVKADYGVTDSATITTTSTTEKPAHTAQDKQLSYLPPPIEKPLRVENDFNSVKFYDRQNYGPSSFSNSLYPTLPTLGWYNKVAFPTKSLPMPIVEHPYPFVVTDLTKKGVPAITMQKSMVDETLVLHQPSYPKMNPWKRAAKIFAAILPIGLLISALTPSILTISPTNDTTQQLCRKLAGRAHQDLSLIQDSLKEWSKPGCEARLLCETAIKEDSLDVDKVKKLFWAFVSQNAEGNETPAELEAVSNAIRDKRCDRIACRQEDSKQSSLEKH